MADAFVFLDDVEITKSGYTRRTKILHRNACDQWLTVPLKKHSDFAKIHELEIAWDRDWVKSHLNNIQSVYAKSPFYSSFFPILKEWFFKANQFKKLSELNMYFIHKVMERLDINTEVQLSSQLPVFGKASDYNIAITKYLNGEIYLSGLGGDGYQNRNIFDEENVALKVCDSYNWITSQEAFNGINPKYSLIHFFMHVDLDVFKNHLKENLHSKIR